MTREQAWMIVLGFSLLAGVIAYQGQKLHELDRQCIRIGPLGQ